MPRFWPYFYDSSCTQLHFMSSMNVQVLLQSQSRGLWRRINYQTQVEVMIHWASKAKVDSSISDSFGWPTLASNFASSDRDTIKIVSSSCYYLTEYGNEAINGSTTTNPSENILKRWENVTSFPNRLDRRDKTANCHHLGESELEWPTIRPNE